MDEILKKGDRVKLVIDGREPYPGRLGTVLSRATGKGFHLSHYKVLFDGASMARNFRLGCLEVVRDHGQSTMEPK